MKSTVHQLEKELVFLKDAIHLILPFSDVFVAARFWLCLSWVSAHSVLALNASRSDYYNTLGSTLPRMLMWESKSPLTGNGYKRWIKHCSGHNGVELLPSPACESTPALQCFIYHSRAFCSQRWDLLQKKWSHGLTVPADSPFAVIQTIQKSPFFLFHCNIFPFHFLWGDLIILLRIKSKKLLSIPQYYVNFSYRDKFVFFSSFFLLLIYL